MEENALTKIFYFLTLSELKRFVFYISTMPVNKPSSNLFKPLCCALRDQNGKEHFQKHSG